MLILDYIAQCRCMSMSNGMHGPAPESGKVWLWLAGWLAGWLAAAAVQNEGIFEHSTQSARCMSLSQSYLYRSLLRTAVQSYELKSLPKTKGWAMRTASFVRDLLFSPKSKLSMCRNSFCMPQRLCMPLPCLFVGWLQLFEVLRLRSGSGRNEGGSANIWPVHWTHTHKHNLTQTRS